MVCVALSGCMSMPVESLKKPAPEKAAELLIFRTSSFFAGGVTAAIGIKNTAFVHLDNKEYAVVQLPEGDHEIFVRARSAQPNVIPTKLQAGQKTCMRIRADAADTISNMRIPSGLLRNGYSFIPFIIECPDETVLKSYKLIPVNYVAN